MPRKKSPAPPVGNCPAGGFCQPVDDVEGQYCGKCLAPMEVDKPKPVKRITTKDDAQILLTIKKLVKMLDDRARKLDSMNGRKHRQCMEAMEHLLATWEDWKASS